MPKEKAENQKVGVFNIVEHPFERGFVLLVKETAPHKAGLYNFAGGGVDEVDRERSRKITKVLKACGIREGEEESGYRLKITHGVSAHERPGNRIHLVVRSAIVGGHLTTSPEHPEVGFFSDAEIHEMGENGKLRWPTIVGDVNKVLRQETTPINQFIANLALEGTAISGDGVIRGGLQPNFTEPVGVAA